MDEQGDVGPVSLCVSESTVSVTVPSGDEALMENFGSEGNVEGEEIMVEVVGSDVFVDGVGEHGGGLGKECLRKEMEMECFRNEGDFGARQVDDSEGRVWDGRRETGVQGVGEIAGSSGGRVEHAVEMEKVEVVSGLSSEETYAVAVEKVEVGVGEEIVEGRVGERNSLRDAELNGGGDGVCGGLTANKVGVLDDEVWNQGIESVNVSSSLMTESTSVHTSFNGEKAAVAVRDEVSSVRDEALRDGFANASLPLLGEDQRLVIETGSEATDKDSINHASAESSDNPAAADASMQVEGVNKEETLQSDNAGMPDNVRQDTGSNGIHEDVRQDTGSNGIHEDVRQDTGSNGIPEDVEGAGAFCSAIMNSIEHNQISSSHPVGINLQTVNQVSGGVEYLATEGKQLFGPNQTIGCIENQELTLKAEIKSKNDVVVCAESEISRYETQAVDEKLIPLVGSKDSSSISEDILSDNNDQAFFHLEDSYGIKEETTLKGIAQRSESMVTDIERLLELENKTPGIDTPDSKLSCSENDKDMKLDESSENVLAERHIVSDGESTRAADGGTFAALDKDGQAITTNIKFDAINTLTSSDKDLLDADTGTAGEHTLVAEGETEVLDDKQTSNSVDQVLDGDASVQNDEKLNTQHFSGWSGEEGMAAATAASLGEDIDTETHKETLVEKEGIVNVPTCDTSHDTNISLLAIEENLKGEMGGVSAAERDIVGSDSALVAEAGMYDMTSPAANSVVGAQNVEAKKQEVFEQQAQTHIQMMDPGQSKDPVISTDAVPVSNVDASGEGNFASCSREENVHVSGNDISPQGGEQSFGNVTSGHVNSNGPMNTIAEVEDESCETNDEHIENVDATEAEFIDLQEMLEVDKRYPDFYQIGSSGEGIGVDEHFPETYNSKIMNDNIIKPQSCFKLHQSGYLLPPVNEGQFSVSDLVWGKVKSHSWWPGQICDNEDASEKAVEYFKKDCYLVAYFGDRTFAWNDASVLKPFRLHFNQIEKQSTSEVFQNAVSCALAEVSRRVELGLACNCIPKDVYCNIEYQVVGIREESSKQYCKDKSSGATSFEPDKLVDYIRGLAQSPSAGTDQLNPVIARAQLLAFCRYKGYRPPSELVCSEEVDENSADLIDHEIKDEQDLSSMSASHKRKHNLEDSLRPKKKEKSLSELMDDVAYSPDDEDGSDGKALGKPVPSSSGRKRKAVDAITDGSEKRISIYAAKVSTTTSTFPKPLFKIGECIRRVASQLTGSASFKANSEYGNDVSPRISENSRGGNMVVSTKFPSLEEMLLQLQLVAENPRKGHSFQNDVITFFSCFRNSVVPGRRPDSLGGRPGSGRKRKISEAIGGATEEFEFDDVNDSYWTDRIVQDYPEEQLLQNGENEGGEHQLVVASDRDRSLKSSRRSRSGKRYSSGNHETARGWAQDLDRKMQQLSPAELILNFAEDSLPSEINLNKLFRRFGPLKESETEVDHESRRAKVVFKRGSDAEVAYSSAGMFNIFGSLSVTYQLSYLSSSSSKALPPAVS